MELIQRLPSGLVIPSGPYNRQEAMPTPFDRDAALARFDGDLDLLRDIAGTFLEHCPHLVAEIDEAATLGDAERLRQAAHSLKGSVANFGAEAATAAAGRLEQMGADGNLDDLDVAHAHLKREIDALTVALAHVVQSPAPGTSRHA